MTFNSYFGNCIYAMLKFVYDIYSCVDPNKKISAYIYYAEVIAVRMADRTIST